MGQRESTGAAFRVLVQWSLIGMLGVAATGTPLAVRAQMVDSTRRDSLAQAPSMAAISDVRSPQGAIRRAMLVPGWGQLYNRQYVKAPVLWAGIGLFLYSAASSNRDYLLYRRAFQYKAYQELVDSGSIAENPRSSFQDEYETVAADLGPVSSRPLEAQRDNFRRNRDLAILGVGAMWALGILDAYVSAHLSDFDVGEDLTLRVHPILPAGRHAALGLNLHVRWHPKRP